MYYWEQAKINGTLVDYFGIFDSGDKEIDRTDSREKAEFIVSELNGETQLENKPKIEAVYTVEIKGIFHCITREELVELKTEIEKFIPSVPMWYNVQYPARDLLRDDEFVSPVKVTWNTSASKGST
jgi:hypothetical protein